MSVGGLAARLAGCPDTGNNESHQAGQTGQRHRLQIRSKPGGKHDLVQSSIEDGTSKGEGKLTRCTWC